MIRPDLIIRTVNGDAMRMKFFFFFFPATRKENVERAGEEVIIFLDAKIIINEKSRSSCFWDLINAEIWRKIRKKNFCNFI